MWDHRSTYKPGTTKSKVEHKCILAWSRLDEMDRGKAEKFTASQIAKFTTHQDDMIKDKFGKETGKKCIKSELYLKEFEELYRLLFPEQKKQTLDAEFKELYDKLPFEPELDAKHGSEPPKLGK